MSVENRHSLHIGRSHNTQSVLMDETKTTDLQRKIILFILADLITHLVFMDETNTTESRRVFILFI